MKHKNWEHKARVLIVDDLSIVRTGVHRLVETEPSLTVCGESDGEVDALRKVVDLRPDIATVDLNLGAGSGLDLIQQMRALRPTLRIVALSMHEERGFRDRASAAGADAFVTKCNASEKLIPTICNLTLDNFSAPSRTTARHRASER